MININEIKYKNNTLAIHFKHQKEMEGIKFLTPTNYPLQIGLMEYKEGKEVPPHIHRDLKYNVNTTQEFLYIEKGSADIVIFNKKWEEIEKLTLKKSDFILFVSGGHSVKINKKTRILEIKQGPYPGDKQAKIFLN